MLYLWRAVYPITSPPYGISYWPICALNPRALALSPKDGLSTQGLYVPSLAYAGLKFAIYAGVIYGAFTFQLLYPCIGS